MTPQHALVWAEIPARDLDRSKAFYQTVFSFDFLSDDSGPNPVEMIKTADETGIAGHIYPGEPSAPGTGLTIHLAVPDTLEATADRFSKSGGTLLGDPIAIPPGRFQYGTDPDGNSIGMFEANKT